LEWLPELRFLQRCLEESPKVPLEPPQEPPPDLGGYGGGTEERDDEGAGPLVATSAVDDAEGRCAAVSSLRRRSLRSSKNMGSGRLRRRCKPRVVNRSLSPWSTFMEVQVGYGHTQLVVRLGHLLKALAVIRNGEITLNEVSELDVEEEGSGLAIPKELGSRLAGGGVADVDDIGEVVGDQPGGP
jgi:hypothetical protein